MIHPSTELRLVDPVIGYGVFATEFIPRGTVLYVQDELEIKVSPEDYQMMRPEYQLTLDKYSFVDPYGIHILSWDFAKYVNHRCDCNSMSTGWGFEIALHDIQAGDEITDEYGLFNLEYEMPVSCSCTNCRTVVKPDDIDYYARKWDRRVKRALLKFNHVHQPLLPHLSTDVLENVTTFLVGESPYISVANLKRSPSPGAAHHGIAI
jgi:hypothetical protein